MRHSTWHVPVPGATLVTYENKKNSHKKILTVAPMVFVYFRTVLLYNLHTTPHHTAPHHTKQTNKADNDDIGTFQSQVSQKRTSRAPRSKKILNTGYHVGLNR